MQPSPSKENCPWPHCANLEVLARKLHNLFIRVPGQPVLARLEAGAKGLDPLPEAQYLGRHSPLAQFLRELLHVEAVAPVETGDRGVVLERDGGQVGAASLALCEVDVEFDVEVLLEAVDDDVGIYQNGHNCHFISNSYPYYTGVNEKLTPGCVNTSLLWHNGCLVPLSLPQPVAFGPPFKAQGGNSIYKQDTDLIDMRRYRLGRIRFEAILWLCIWVGDTLVLYGAQICFLYKCCIEIQVRSIQDQAHFLALYRGRRSFCFVSSTTLNE